MCITCLVYLIEFLHINWRVKNVNTYVFVHLCRVRSITDVSAACLTLIAIVRNSGICKYLILVILGQITLKKIVFTSLSIEHVLITFFYLIVVIISRQI